MPDQDRLGVGANFPPEPIDPEKLGHAAVTTLIDADPVHLAARLERDYDPMLRRFAEIELGCTQAPATIDDEAAAAKIVNWDAGQVKPLLADAERAHKLEKAPYFACGKAVDAFFLRRIDRLNLAVSRVLALADDYTRRKKVEQRAREQAAKAAALAEQRRLEAEARRLETEAKKKAPTDRSGANELMAQAKQQEALAETAAEIAARPPQPVHIKGDYGATAYLQERWHYEVTDPAKIPLAYLMPDDQSIREAIKNGVRDIPGLRIFSNDRFINRRC